MAVEIPATPENIEALATAVRAQAGTVAALSVAPSLLLHLGTEVKTTFAVPDGKGNAQVRAISVAVADLTEESWLVALGAVRKARDEAQGGNI